MRSCAGSRASSKAPGALPASAAVSGSALVVASVSSFWSSILGCKCLVRYARTNATKERVIRHPVARQHESDSVPNTFQRTWPDLVSKRRVPSLGVGWVWHRNQVALPRAENGISLVVFEKHVSSQPKTIGPVKGAESVEPDGCLPVVAQPKHGYWTTDVIGIPHEIDGDIRLRVGCFHRQKHQQQHSRARYCNETIPLRPTHADGTVRNGDRRGPLAGSSRQRWSHRNQLNQLVPVQWSESLDFGAVFIPCQNGPQAHGAVCSARCCDHYPMESAPGVIH